jgi:hypothetical protein
LTPFHFPSYIHPSWCAKHVMSFSQILHKVTHIIRTIGTGDHLWTVHLPLHPHTLSPFTTNKNTHTSPMQHPETRKQNMCVLNEKSAASTTNKSFSSSPRSKTISLITFQKIHKHFWSLLCPLFFSEVSSQYQIY